MLACLYNALAWGVTGEPVSFRSHLKAQKATE